MAFFVFAFVFFIAFLLYWLTKRILKNQKKKKAASDVLLFQSILQFIKELDKNTEMKALKRTELKKIKNDLETSLDDFLEKKMTKEDLEQKFLEYQNTIHLFSEEIQKLKKEKASISSAIQFEINKFNQFLRSSSVYPKPFLFYCNKLQGKLTDVHDAKIDTLAKELREAESYLKDFQKKTRNLYQLYDKIVQYVANNSNVSLEERQEIYFHFQQGKLDIVEDLLDKHLSQSKNEKKSSAHHLFLGPANKEKEKESDISENSIQKK